MKNLLLYMVYLIFMLLITGGCISSDRPSDSEIREMYLNEVYSGQDGAFAKKVMKITDVVKVNGYLKDNNSYIAEVNTKVKFLLDSKEIYKLAVENGDSPINTKLFIRMFNNKYGGISRGKLVETELNVEFIKTEKGWKIKDISERKL